MPVVAPVVVPVAVLPFIVPVVEPVALPDVAGFRAWGVFSAGLMAALALFRAWRAMRLAGV